MSAFAQSRTFGLAIWALNNGHSLNAIFLFSPSPMGHFGKAQLGPDLGNTKPFGVRQRHRGGGSRQRFAFEKTALEGLSAVSNLH